MNTIGALGPGIALAALLGLAACAPSAGPASPTPAGAGLTPSTLPFVSTVVPASPGTPPAGGMTPGGAGAEMGEMGQMMGQMGAQLNQMMGDQVSPSQMQQMMDLMAGFSIQMAQGAAQAPEGTMEMRRMVVLTLRQMGEMALQLRDRMPQMTPDQEQEATRQMVQLIVEMGQVMGQMQGMGPQPSQVDQQQFMTRMQRVQAILSDLRARFRLPPPSLATPASAMGRG